MEGDRYETRTGDDDRPEVWLIAGEQETRIGVFPPTDEGKALAEAYRDRRNGAA